MKMQMYAIILMMTTSIVVLGCKPTMAVNDFSGVKAEIKDAVKESNSAYEAFPKTLDSTGPLKHYANDFSGVSNGKSQTLKDLENGFDEIAERVKLGDQIRFSSKISDLNIQPLTERLAWLTYQHEVKVGRGGESVGEIKSKCSTLVRKDAEIWVIFHEHCSSIKESLLENLERRRH